jgi:hypothetical protein
VGTGRKGMECSNEGVARSGQPLGSAGGVCSCLIREMAKAVVCFHYACYADAYINMVTVSAMHIAIGYFSQNRTRLAGTIAAASGSGSQVSQYSVTDFLKAPRGRNLDRSDAGGSVWQALHCVC